MSKPVRTVSEEASGSSRKKVSHKNTSTVTSGDGSFETGLNAVCEDLVYISETDAPILPFVADEADVGALITAIKERNNKPVKRTTINEFFANPTRERDWHDAAAKERVRRFVKLKQFLKDNLKDPVCLRSGRIQIDIFVVGADPQGRLAGIRTYAVET